MPSKKRGSKIKKDRLMSVLKSRKITITKLAEDLSYNRSALSSAINSEYMDNKTLDDICRYLDVYPSFITGETPLMVLNNVNSAYIPWQEKYWADFVQYKGMLVKVPKYTDDGLNLWKQDQQLYKDLILFVGKEGLIYDEINGPVYFDSDFAEKYISYFKDNIFNAIEGTYFSIQNQDDLFTRWQEMHASEEDASKYSLFKIIEEPEDAEEDA